MRNKSIIFLPIGRDIKINAKETIMEIAQNNGIYIENVCAGKGACGKCKVQIIRGKVTPLTDIEKRLLTEEEIRKHYRLACEVKICWKEGNEKKEGKENIEKKEDKEKKEDIGNQEEEKAGWVVRIPVKNEEQVKKKKEIILPRGFHPDKYEDKCIGSVDYSRNFYEKCGQYGIALDIGTTTMVGILWDMNRAEMLEVITKENPQRIIGADILSRMKYVNEKNEHLEKIHRMTVQACNEMIIQLFEQLYLRESTKNLAVISKGNLYNNSMGQGNGINESFINHEQIKKKIKFQKEKSKFENDKKCDDENKKTINSFIRKNLSKVVVVGNTAMLHFFMGYETYGLSRYPFSSMIEGSVVKRAYEVGLVGNENVRVEVVGIISGQIGSDIVAGILATNLMGKSKKESIILKEDLFKRKLKNDQNFLMLHKDVEKNKSDVLKKENDFFIENDKNELLIDIGTNGEMVLKAGQRVLACSVAAGPAFEGGSIFNGMRADTGAIQGISLKDGQIELNVIGGKEAKGICGSGLINIVAHLLDWGLVDETGRILDCREARKNGVSFELCRRICKERDESNSFVLKFGTGPGKIVLMQKDIRELQVAKSAISSAIQILVKEAGIKIENLQDIKIAGVFGNYLDKENAIRIGLFPNIRKEKLSLVGNTAGIGASMILLSKRCAEKARMIPKRIKRIELSERKDFSEIYFENMNFK